MYYCYTLTTHILTPHTSHPPHSHSYRAPNSAPCTRPPGWGRDCHRRGRGWLRRVWSGQGLGSPLPGAVVFEPAPGGGREGEGEEERGSERRERRGGEREEVRTLLGYATASGTELSANSRGHWLSSEQLHSSHLTACSYTCHSQRLAKG